MNSDVTAQPKLLYNFLIAITLHIIIFALFSNFFYARETIGIPIPNVQVYLIKFSNQNKLTPNFKNEKPDEHNHKITDATKNFNSVLPKVVAKKPETFKVNNIKAEQPNLKKTSVNKSTSKQVISLNNINGTENPLLLALHNAILNAETYPEQAQVLEQQGVVNLQFVLSSRGEVNNIKILHSSGFALLDRAAVVAIQSINPFQPAKKYLTSSQSFTIAIRFKD